jgi:hypothetical protein
MIQDATVCELDDIERIRDDSPPGWNVDRQYSKPVAICDTRFEYNRRRDSPTVTLTSFSSRREK